MSQIIPAILCGGIGSRLWPISRESLPKQFINFTSQGSSLQNIIAAFSKSAAFAPPIIICKEAHRFIAARQISEIQAQASIILEPISRGSALAAAVATIINERQDPQAVIGIFAADNYIDDPSALLNCCQRAAYMLESEAGREKIVTFGIIPTSAKAEYGYIGKGNPIGDYGYEIAHFAEKPSKGQAKLYIDQGYLWNSGNFIFQAATMKQELAVIAPEILQAAQGAVKNACKSGEFLHLSQKDMEKSPNISIDYAIMEHSKRGAVIPTTMEWLDIGSWDMAAQLYPTDEHGNSIAGSAIIVDSANTHIHSHSRLTAVIGTSDIIVVNDDDATLVVHKSQAQKVKPLVEQLKKQGYSQATEHNIVYRPWGYYQILNKSQSHQVKRIVVYAGGQLSLQKHQHRSEHWVVVRGQAEIVRDSEMLILGCNQSIYLPAGCIHRLTNRKEDELEVIEVQIGEYLGEDDIIRLEDLYNRV